MTTPNLFADLPADAPEEIFDVLAEAGGVKIERIVSTGQSSPPDFWYDQDDHEWVVVLRGRAAVDFDDGRRVELGVGDHFLIPAHARHRVAWTSPDTATVWLAVFYPPSVDGSADR